MEEEEKETANANENEALVEQQAAAVAESGAVDLKSLSPVEQKEVVQEILAAEAEIEAMALPQISSSELLNQPINILDAGFRQIPDGDGFKACVSFVCEFADGERFGEQFTVLKGSNAFNNTYVNYFDKIRGILSKPLQNYEFVEDPRYKVGNNVAHVLRRISPAIQAARGGK